VDPRVNEQRQVREEQKEDDDAHSALVARSKASRPCASPPRSHHWCAVAVACGALSASARTPSSTRLSTTSTDPARWGAISGGAPGAAPPGRQQPSRGCPRRSA